MDYSKFITVTAAPNFIPEQSDAPHQKYVWSYDITITNTGDQIVQLVHRYWRITDMTGKVEEVHGAGVVGLQPLLKPGKTFTYTSYCQLATTDGSMEGHYEFQDLNDIHFSVTIPKFILTTPAGIGVQTLDRSRLH